MSCCQGQDYDEMFDAKTASKQLKKYEKRGPTGETKRLLESVLPALEGLERFTHLDIGGGVGVLQHELARCGAQRTTAVDASAPYLALLREAAQSRGYEARQRCIEGDFTEVAEKVESSTVVTLDKVICCYPHMEALVRASAEKAEAIYAIVVPRDVGWVRWGAGLANWFVRAVLRWKFQSFIHSLPAIDRVVSEAGLRMIRAEPGWFWCVRVYQRRAASTPGA